MKGKLPRLDPSFYQGRAYVFWTHTTEQRAWFDWNDARHAYFREILLHTCLRYRLATPVYCLMPDHIHLFWIGLAKGSDQLKGCAFFRKYFGEVMQPEWQPQAHDHVVRESERSSGLYADTIQYILNNPVRAELAERWEDYPYLGAMLAGYPDLDRRDPDFHERFWKCVQMESE